MKNKIVAKTQQIQILGGKPIYVIKCQRELRTHANLQQNFRIFWVRMHFRVLNLMHYEFLAKSTYVILVCYV